MSSSKEPHSAETETAGNMAAAEPAVSNDHMDRWLERFAHAAFQRSADTAHDLKTPLNVAVLNLELLRMRMRKLGGSDDEKVLNYARSIEVELRRLARIFDAFFLFSVPPKGEENPAAIDLGAICREAGRADGYELGDEASFSGHAHESRIRTAFKLFFEGTGRVLQPQSRTARLSIAAKEMTVEV